MAIDIKVQGVSKWEKYSDDELKEELRMCEAERDELDNKISSIENELFYRNNPECRDIPGYKIINP